MPLEYIINNCNASCEIMFISLMMATISANKTDNSIVESKQPAIKKLITLSLEKFIMKNLLVEKMSERFLCIG